MTRSTLQVNALRNERFPRSNRDDPKWIIENQMGLNPLWLTEWVWVYDRTGSLLVAMLMHVSLTASVRIFNPLPNVGVPLFIYDLALAAAMWVVVAAVAVANGGQLARQPR